MATIKEIHTSAFSLFQDLIPKSIVISYPANTTNANLANKRFKPSKVIASALSSDRMKVYQNTYTNEAISITIFNDVIAETKDLTNTINMPYSGFKDAGCKISFKNKNYIIKEENINPFDGSITLMCDTKV